MGARYRFEEGGVGEVVVQLAPDLRAIRRRRRCEALRLLWVWRWLWRRGCVSSPAAGGCWGRGRHLHRAPPTAASAATCRRCRFAPDSGGGRGARRTPPISCWRRVLLIGAVAAQVELPRVERRRARRRARRELLLAPLRAAAPRGRRRLSCRSCSCSCPAHAAAAAGALRAAAEGVGAGHGAGGGAPRGGRVAGGDHRRGWPNHLALPRPCHPCRGWGCGSLPSLVRERLK